MGLFQFYRRCILSANKISAATTVDAKPSGSVLDVLLVSFHDILRKAPAPPGKRVLRL